MALKKIADEGKTFMHEEFELTDDKIEEIHEKASSHAEACRFNINSTISKDKIPKEMMCKCGCGRGRG